MAGKSNAKTGPLVMGPRTVLSKNDARYPKAFLRLAKPPETLYVLGSVSALREGLAVVGARRATPYGIGCAKRFAFAAATKGIVIISGGARGCDAQAHRAALAAGTPTVVFLGGGCDVLYPLENYALFQEIVDKGGALVSEHPWDFTPVPYAFRERNRLIASLAKATLIVEAGLPSGTFSTADQALASNRDVLVVPGSIMSESSHGSNRLLYQGATPVVDDETFEDVLFSIFGCLKQEVLKGAEAEDEFDELYEAICAKPSTPDELLVIASTMCGDKDPNAWLMEYFAMAEITGKVVRYPNGKWGPKVN